MVNTRNKGYIAVIGENVRHSLSPVIHNFWLEKYAIDYIYLPINVKNEDFEEVIKILPKMGFIGANITFPYKQAVINLFKQDQIVKEIKAANTIKYGGFAYNTDVFGFNEIIDEYKLKATTTLIIGAGGAARAIVHALRMSGFKDIIIANRSLNKALELKKDMHLSAEPLLLKNISSVINDIDLIVNCSNLGMAEEEESIIDFSNVKPQAIICDLVYSPLETPMLKAAKNNGNKVIDGLELLINQAAKSFEIWFGIYPDKKFLKKYLIDYLKK